MPPSASSEILRLSPLAEPSRPEPAGPAAENRTDGAASRTDVFAVAVARDAAAPARADDSALASREFRRFEAMVLQTFIQNMLPREGAGVYGQGVSGEMWKSKMAEQLAAVMAERGGIGIAERMLSARYADQAGKLSADRTAASNI